MNKQIKRYISLVLAILICFGVCPAQLTLAEEGTPTLIYLKKDFEAQTIGDEPWGFESGLSPWAKEAEKRNAPIGAVEEIDGNKAAVMTSNSNTTLYPYPVEMQHPMQYAPVQDTFVLSFRFRAGDVNSEKQVKMNYNLVKARNTDYLDAHDTTAMDFLTITNEVKAMGTPISGKIAADTWYTVDALIDVKKHSAQVSFNGGAYQGIALPGNLFNIGSVRFVMPRSDGYTLAIDDIAIYEADRVLTKAELDDAYAEYAASGFMSPEKYEVGRLYRHDKLVYVTMYGKTVTLIGAGRLFKDNKFYKLPVQVREENGKIVVPVRAFAEAFGAEVDWISNPSTLIVSHNGRTMKAVIGSDVYYINDKPAKLYSPVTVVNGTACIQLDVLAAFLKVQYSRKDDMLCFGDAPEVKYNLKHLVHDTKGAGYNCQGYTLEEEIFKGIRFSLLNDRPTAEEIRAAYEAWNPEHSHPRVMLTEFDAIKNGMETDEEFLKLVNSTINAADNRVANGVVENSVKDGLRSDYSQSVKTLGMNIPLAYHITKETNPDKAEDYIEYLRETANTLNDDSIFPDLNPQHALDSGNNATGLGTMYDWMYNEWSEEDRAVVENIIVKKLFPIIETSFRKVYYHSANAWVYGKGNQPLIINNGFIACALALMDKYPELCSEIIANSLRSIEMSMTEFGPDGAWVEGISYWQYTCDTLPFIFNNLQSGLGYDFGISNAPGLMKTANFPLAMAGSIGSTFALGDDNPQGPWHGWFMFQAKQTNDKSLAKLRKANMGNSSMIDVLNWVYDTDEAGETQITDDAYFRLMETATMRTGRDSADTTVLLHGGGWDDGHGHEDLGTFQFDMLGERWATEVDKENYNIVEYGSEVIVSGAENPNKGFIGRDFYRSKAEGHNTVIAGLGTGETDQRRGSRADMEKIHFGETGSYALLNMTDTNELFECAVRGVKLDKVNNEIMVQDNIRASEDTEFWWFMHTKADVELAPDGKSAILSMNNKKIWAGIVSEGDETFQVLDAKPMEGYKPYPPVQSANTGVRKLAIQKQNSDKFNVTVAFKPLMAGETAPSRMPVDAPMETWEFVTSKLSTLKSVTVDGAPLADFNPDGYNYSINVSTEKSPVPKIEVEADENISVEVIETETVPGTTSVLLSENGELTGIYNFIINPLNDTTKFFEEKQIPIQSLSVTSEPQPENPATALFDANFATKFATDETGGGVTVDFGDVKKVDRIMMSFQNGTKRTENFKIEYSTDGINFKTAYEGHNSGTTTELEPYKVGAEARYIRVSFYGNNGGSNWVSVTEMYAAEE